MICFKFECDNCSKILVNGNYAYCSDCYVKLQNEIDELIEEKIDLENRIDKLENDVHDLKEEIRILETNTGGEQSW